MQNFINKIIATTYAQDLISCPDGTLADPSIGCVVTPSAIVRPESSITEIILKIANGLMGVMAGLAVIMLIYGGIRYAMAAGSEDQIKKAKAIILWSGFGLILALLAVFITNLVLSSIS